ncbi:MAG: hypothetical protein ACJ73S_29040 [Mycobacteriales bacterium]
MDLTALVADDPDPALRLGKPHRYRYLLPGNWIGLDPSPARSAATIRRAVEARVRRFPALAPYRRTLHQLLRHAVNQAIAKRAVALALLSEPVGEAVVSASMTIMLGPGIPFTSGGYLNHPEQVAAYLSRQVPAGQVDNGRREVGVVPLSQQRAVRTRTDLMVTDESSGLELAAHGVEYLVPVPGTAGLLTMAFSTPCLPAADALATLFDAVAGTFYWEWDGADTLPGHLLGDT